MYKVKVENQKQLEIVLKEKNVSEIILSRDSFAESDLPKLIDKIKNFDKLAWILMERISRYEESMKTIGVNVSGDRMCRGELCEPLDLRTSTDKIYEIKNLDGIIIQNFDSFTYMLRKISKVANKKLMVELNYTINCYNDVTKMVLTNLYNEKRNNANEVPLLFTAPVELNTYELSEVGYDTMIVYSYIDTMVSANCLKKNLNLGTGYIIDKKGTPFGKTKNPVTMNSMSDICKNRFNFNNVQDFSSYIIDRKGKKLHYKTYCKYCYNKIFNTEPLYLLDKTDEIMESKIVGATHGESAFRIDFSFENEKEVRDILSMKCPKTFTRGHYKNSIK